MITIIQQKIVDLLLQATNINPEFVYQEELGDGDYNSPPYIEIIPLEARIKTSWDNPQYHQSQRFQQKYSVEQPIQISFVYGNKESLEIALCSFLSILPRYISLNQQAIEITPSIIKYRFLKGGLDNFKAMLTIKAQYLIYTGQTTVPVIKDIHFETEAFYE